MYVRANTENSRWVSVISKKQEAQLSRGRNHVEGGKNNRKTIWHNQPSF